MIFHRWVAYRANCAILKEAPLSEGPSLSRGNPFEGAPSLGGLLFPGRAPFQGGVHFQGTSSPRGAPLRGGILFKACLQGGARV